MREESAHRQATSDEIEALKGYNQELYNVVDEALIDISSMLNPSMKNHCKYCYAYQDAGEIIGCRFACDDCKQHADYKGAIIKLGSKLSKLSSDKYDLDVRLLFLEGRRLSTIYDALVEDITQILHLSHEHRGQELCMFCEYVSECEHKRDVETCRPRWRYSKCVVTSQEKVL